jgi:sialate O-acetylesterase
MFRKLLILICVFVSTGVFAGALRVANIFSDGMVLQQEMNVPVWGTAAAGAEVMVSFASQKKRTTADAKGKWMVKLDPLNASDENAKMTITSGAHAITIKDVLVGEVWLCGGQSNMAWTLAGLTKNPGNEEFKPVHDYLVNEIATANDPLLRFMSRKWIPAVSPEVKDFSGTGYFFGRKLRKELGVPVGLINANRGGTRIEPWIPKTQFLKTDAGKSFYESEYKQMAKSNSKKKGQSNKLPSGLFNGTIAPLVPYAIRGAVWYQGESNCNYRSEHYKDSMLDLIEGWREHWGQDEFAFYWCQLANKHAANAEPSDKDPWAEIQNQQREVLALTTDTGMAVLNDIGEARNIHPKNKVDAGRRLALWPLKHLCGKDIVCSGPLYKSSAIDGSKVIIKFSHTGSGLMVGEKHLMEPAKEVHEPLNRFQICGADRKWKWAQARIVGKDTVEVWHKDIPDPVEVRYAWSSNPEGANLYNKEGLPASLFKTDMAE